MFPFNFASVLIGGVGSRLLAAAKEKGMGILALKAMARCRLADGDTPTLPSPGHPGAEPRKSPKYAVWCTPQPAHDLRSCTRTMAVHVSPASR